jgi:hypothetical protein
LKTDLDEAKDELKVLKRDYQEVHEFKSKNDGLLKEIGMITITILLDIFFAKFSMIFFVLMTYYFSKK